MAKYDLRFRTSDWDGTGFDLELAAITEAGAIDSVGVSTILNAIAQRCSYGNHRPDSDSMYWVVPIKSLGVFPFNGYVEVHPPDQLAIGGRAEDFYTGDESTDRQVALTLVALLKELAKDFGTVHIAFGADHNAMGRARQMRRDAWLPNAKSTPSTDQLVQGILDFCRTLRP